MSNRRRNLFVILLVLGLIAVSGAVIAAKPTRLGLDLKGGVQLVYKAVQIAAHQKPVVDTNNTAGEQFYLFKPNRTFAAGPDATRQDLLSQYNGRKPHSYQIVTVPPGTVVVRAEKPDKFPKNKPFEQ